MIRPNDTAWSRARVVALTSVSPAARMKAPMSVPQTLPTPPMTTASEGGQAGGRSLTQGETVQEDGEEHPGRSGGHPRQDQDERGTFGPG